MWPDVLIGEKELWERGILYMVSKYSDNDEEIRITALNDEWRKVNHDFCFFLRLAALNLLFFENYSFKGSLTLDWFGSSFYLSSLFLIYTFEEFSWKSS